MDRHRPEPVVEILLADGRTAIPERRRGDPLRRYRPPVGPGERRRRPRREDAGLRGRRLDLIV